MDQAAGHRRRHQALRRLLPRPRGPAALRRHLLLPAGRRAGRQPGGGQSEGRGLARPLPRPGHLRRVRPDRVAASKQVETSTLAAYRSYLDKHFIPVFGSRPMGKILPSEVQRWVTTATENGLSAASVGKYHTMLHSVFERALHDRVITFNPCAHTELPKRVKKKNRTPTPGEYDAILAALPAQHRLMVETAINTGLRWGELIALKPRHLDLTVGRLTVEETIVEVSLKNSPSGRRMLTKPYPKDNEPRTLGLPEDLVTQLAEHIADRRLKPGDLLFATRDGTPISRNTFRTRVWLPAIKKSGVDFDVRVHDLRHAHASWLLAGGSDLKAVMDRMGHAQITTTQKYLHPMPDADFKNLTALDRIRNTDQRRGEREPGAGPGQDPTS
jgi:integrase